MAASPGSSQRYMVTARKYRPKLFRELVAQQHVSDTLKNAIRLDRLAHAYLFSGPRGVGKTTAARILAKAINCTAPPEERADEAEPCRRCESCRSFEEGRSLGIFEIDAASNNKVDDIRELRETVRVPPQGSRKKVYIIDEVHMLSNQAFNALLKTLEEPPPHVLFIFATTEPHKVLPTILSRCQRFDFRRIPVPDIVARLREICEEEGVEADEESLILIARKGDGALRDALSAFDQAVSLCGSTLRYADLAQALGVVDVELFFRLADHIADRHSAGVLQLVDDVIHAGYDLQEFLSGVTEHLRNLLVAVSLEDHSLIEAAESTRERYAAQAARFSEPDLLRLLMVAGDAEDDVKASSQPRMKLEMALLKMASLTHTADLTAVLEQINRIEDAIDDGHQITDSDTADAANTPRQSNDAGSGTTAKKAPESSSKPGARPEAGSPTLTTSEKKRSKKAAVNTSDNAEAEHTPDPTSAEKDEPRPETRSSKSVRPTRADQNRERTPTATGEPAPTYRTLFKKPALDKNPDDASSPQNHGGYNSGDGAMATTATAIAPSRRTESGIVAEHWEEVVEEIRGKSIMIGSYLQRARPLSLEAGALRLAVPDVHSRDLLRSEENHILNRLSEAVGRETERLDIVIQNDLEDAGNTETARESDPYETLKRMRQEHEVVRAIFDKFGGEIVH